MELFDFLNDISHKKKGVIRDEPNAEKDYNPYVINKFLSQHIDCILYVNEMNIRPYCDNLLQFDYFINSLRKQYRKASKWFKPEMFDDIECVKEYFGYSTTKAKQALSILTEEQLQHIRFRLRKGGLKNE